MMDLRRGEGVLRILTAALFVGSGVLHLVRPDYYVRIVPPDLPAPLLLVAISGVAEIIGGVGLLIPKLRRVASWGLITLLVTVFPANIYMAVAAEQFSEFPWWALWARLPLQLVLLACVGWLGRRVDSPLHFCSSADHERRPTVLK